MSSGTVGKVISRFVALNFVLVALFGIFFVPDESMSPVLRWAHGWLRWPMAFVCLYFAIREWRHPTDFVRSKPPPFPARNRGQAPSDGGNA